MSEASSVLSVAPERTRSAAPVPERPVTLSTSDCNKTSTPSSVSNSLNGCRLLGHVHDAHAALADLLQQLVRAGHSPRLFHQWRLVDGRRGFKQRLVQQPSG